MRASHAIRAPLQTSRREIFLRACCQALRLVKASGLISMNGPIGYTLADAKGLATRRTDDAPCEHL